MRSMTVGGLTEARGKDEQQRGIDEHRVIEHRARVVDPKLTAASATPPTQTSSRYRTAYRSSSAQTKHDEPHEAHRARESPRRRSGRSGRWLRRRATDKPRGRGWPRPTTIVPSVRPNATAPPSARAQARSICSTASTTSSTVRTALNWSGLMRFFVSSCKRTARSTASMLSRSRSSYRRAFGVICSGVSSNSAQSSRLSSLKIWSRDRALTFGHGSRR